MHVRIAALVALFVIAATDARAQTAADTGHKSPVLAGVTSYFLPGVGSWYAGNDQHARVHGGIAAGLGLVAAGISVVGDCVELACTEEAPNVALGIVIIAYLTNEIWSTVTAVRDAQTRNDRTERLRAGRIEVAPTLRLVAPPSDPARWRVEMRVLRLGF